MLPPRQIKIGKIRFLMILRTMQSVPWNLGNSIYYIIILLFFKIDFCAIKRILFVLDFYHRNKIGLRKCKIDEKEVKGNKIIERWPASLISNKTKTWMRVRVRG